MESYGALLKQAREDKNLDLDTVARDTSIIRPYIEGLENEDNGAFPGDAYLVGFLKNYSEYLGLDSNQMMLLYKNKLLQEAPVPEGLIVHERPKYLIPLIVSGSVVFAGLLTFLLIFFLSPKSDPDAEAKKNEQKNEKIHEIVDRTFEGRVKEGEILMYNDGKSADPIQLTVCSTVGKFGLQNPAFGGAPLYVDLAEEVEFDIDGDSKSDLIIYVKDISLNNKDRGADIRVVKCSGNSVSSVSMSDIPYVTELGTTNKRTVILEDNRAYPFTLNGTFRGSCIFRYKVDRRDSAESYFTSGEVLSMTASNGIRLWMSNSNTLKLSVIADSRSFDLELGKAGQVVAEDIKWIKDSDGKYKLVVIELD